MGGIVGIRDRRDHGLSDTSEGLVPRENGPNLVSKKRPKRAWRIAIVDYNKKLDKINLDSSLVIN